VTEYVVNNGRFCGELELHLYRTTFLNIDQVQKRVVVKSAVKRQYGYRNVTITILFLILNI